MSNTPANRPTKSDPDDFPSRDHDAGDHVNDVSIAIELIVDDALEPTLPPESRLCDALKLAARHRGCNQGELGLRICSDESIHKINRDHLSHDYPTDVISFGYGCSPPQVDGELIVSIDTAASKAADLRRSTGQSWSTDDELLLYVIHGTLHICGMDDQTALQRQAMRTAEVAVLKQLGIDGRPDVESVI